MRRGVVELLALSVIFLLFYISRGLYIPVVPLYIEGVVHSYSIVGLASMITSLSLTLFQYLWGYLSDKIKSRRIIIVVGLAITGIVFLAYPLARDPIAILVLRFVEGAGTASVYTGVPAAIGDLSSKLKIGFGVSISFARMLGSLGFATASLLGSRALSSYVTAFLIAGILPLLSIPLALVTRGGIARKKMEGLEITRHFGFFAVVAIWSTAFMAVAGLWPNYMVSIGYSFRDVYFYWALAAYGEVPFMMLCGYLTDKGLFRLSIIASSLFMMMTYAIYVFSPSPTMLFIAQAFRSLAYAFFEVSTLTYATKFVGEAFRGRLVGLRNTALTMGWVIGSLYGGVISDMMGLSNMILSAALLLVIPAALMIKVSTPS